MKFLEAAPGETDQQAALARIESFIELFDDLDPSMVEATEILHAYFRDLPHSLNTSDLEWGKPGDCLGNGLDETGPEQRHYGYPHCIRCLEAS